MKRWQYNLFQTVGRALLIAGVLFLMQQWSYGVELFIFGFIVILFSLLYVATLVIRNKVMRKRWKIFNLSMMFLPTVIAFLLVKDETWVKYMALAFALMSSNIITMIFVLPKVQGEKTS